MEWPLTKAAVTLAACGTALLLWRLARSRRESSRVSALIAASAAAYADKQYDAALDAASEACEHARKHPALGGGSKPHLHALIHLGSVQHAMRKSESALETLELCETLTRQLHGEGARALVPVLHAQAEVLEACERWAEATAVLEAACAIRCAGGAADDAARGAFNLAQALAQEAVQSEDMNAAERTKQVERAAERALEAASALASAGGDAEESAHYVRKVLEVLLDEDDKGLVAESGQCEAAMRRLGDELKRMEAA